MLKIRSPGFYNSHIDSPDSPWLIKSLENAAIFWLNKDNSPSLVSSLPTVTSVITTDIQISLGLRGAARYKWCSWQHTSDLKLWLQTRDDGTKALSNLFTTQLNMPKKDGGIRGSYETAMQHKGKKKINVLYKLFNFILVLVWFGERQQVELFWKPWCS